jgi:hypothetical protein
LSDGQRAYDLEILVENVAFGLADLAAMQSQLDDPDDAIVAAERVRDRYEQVWLTIHDEPVLHPDDRQAIRNRVRKLNELGYSVDLDIDPDAADGRVRLRMSVTTRRYHARELERRTRIRALEGQARLLLNDLNEYGTWLDWHEGRKIDGREVADRWLRDVYRPTLARISQAVGPSRDLVQAYCDVLEQKWYLSEQAGRDIGLGMAIDSYLAMGAPAPEIVRGNDAATPTSPADEDEPTEIDALAAVDQFEVTDPAGDSHPADAGASGPEPPPLDR